MNIEPATSPRRLGFILFCAIYSLVSALYFPFFLKFDHAVGPFTAIHSALTSTMIFCFAILALHPDNIQSISIQSGISRSITRLVLAGVSVVGFAGGSLCIFVTVMKLNAVEHVFGRSLQEWHRLVVMVYFTVAGFFILMLAMRKSWRDGRFGATSLRAVGELVAIVLFLIVFEAVVFFFYPVAGYLTLIGFMFSYAQTAPLVRVQKQVKRLNNQCHSHLSRSSTARERRHGE